MNRLRRPAPLFAVIAALALTGCGSDDGDAEPSSNGPDGAAMATAFAERSAEAYEAEGSDRERDFAAGLVLDDCFALDAQGLKALGEALEGVDVRTDTGNYLHGPPGEDETITCSLLEGDDASIGTLIAGTTVVDSEGMQERLERFEEVEEVDGEAPGLDPADVVATDAEGVIRLAWVSDGFLVGVFGATEPFQGEAGFEALSVAVERVARTLGA